MQPQRIATRCADSESGEVRAVLAEGIPCTALTGGTVSSGFFGKLSAFFWQASCSLEFLFLAALKLGLILHWQPPSALQGFGGGGLVAQTSVCGVPPLNRAETPQTEV